MFRKIWNTLGDNWLIVIAAVVALAVAGMSEAQTVDSLQHCQDEQTVEGTIIADSVTITGDAWMKKWDNGQVSEIPGTAIEFWFGDNVIIPDLGPDHIKADHIGSTANWLATGTTFGLQRPDGALWIIAAIDDQCRAYVVAR